MVFDHFTKPPVGGILFSLKIQPDIKGISDIFGTGG